jgi:hypothetical protein
MNQQNEKDILKVLAGQKERVNAEQKSAEELGSAIETAIARTETLVGGNGTLPNDEALSCAARRQLPELREWQELVEEANSTIPDDTNFAAILSAEQIQAVEARHGAWEREFADLHRLGTYDYVISGVAGLLAGVIDVLLIQVPQHPGFLGGGAHSGGWLSRLIKERFGELLPDETVTALEQDFYVPYDPSTNEGLNVPVPGLGPRTHRLHSLGHDPILSWMFGVRDILRGEFSAIGADGKLVIQQVPGFDATSGGANLFIRLFEAFRTVGGHLLSDLTTPAGLPPPFASLLLFIQNGFIGSGRHTVADVVRAMYRSGYDFAHFLATSIPVMLIEAVVRISYFIRELHGGASFIEALPLANKSRLRSQLFLAHSVAAAVNAGKVAVMGTPLAVNWAQWLAFFRYLLPQLHWVLIGKETERRRYIEQRIDTEWDGLRVELTDTWRLVFGNDAPKAVLV